MVRTKINRKKIAKTRQQFQGKLQQKASFAFGGKESTHHDEVPNEISSMIIQKPTIPALRSLRSSAVLPESTPSQRSKAFHVKRLTDVFTKLPNQGTAILEEKMTQHANISQSSAVKEILAVPPGDPSNTANSLTAGKATEREVEQNVEIDQGETPEPISSDVAQHTNYSKEQQLRMIKFYFYPIEDGKKWIKDELAKSKPKKKHVPKKMRTFATDELTEVLLWNSPSKKRTLRDLTDLEVAFTVFQHAIDEFSECVSERSILMLIKKYEELFERSIVEKLQSIEDAQNVQQQINKLNKENKALSLNMGSLVDRKIKLQNEIAKRRVPRQK